MKKQPYWTSVIVALIGLAGSVLAAKIIAGDTFDDKLKALKAEVDEIKLQEANLSRKLGLVSGQLSEMSAKASHLETRLDAVDKASFPLADTLLGTVDLDRNVIADGGHIKAFVTTGSSSPLVIATPRSGDYNDVLTVFAGAKTYGGQAGILITVYPSQGKPFPPNVNIGLTLLQQGAQSYAPAILYVER